MNLKQIKDYPNYSFDLNTNQVYSHYSKIYLKPRLNNRYYEIRLYKNSKRKDIRLHRLVYEAYNGEIPTGYVIDHIDLNTHNNHITNLRLATISQNSCNQKVNKNNKSTGYKNIFLTKNNTYRVKIKKNNKVVYCKNFKTLEEAIINRDIQMKLNHEEFCNLG